MSEPQMMIMITRDDLEQLIESAVRKAVRTTSGNTPPSSSRRRERSMPRVRMGAIASAIMLASTAGLSSSAVAR